MIVRLSLPEQSILTQIFLQYGRPQCTVCGNSRTWNQRG